VTARQVMGLRPVVAALERCADVPLPPPAASGAGRVPVPFLVELGIDPDVLPGA
jgi:hypothetical protein